MSGYFANLYNRLFPKQKKIYLPEILKAAKVEGCKPSKIFWCKECKALHEDFYERN